MTDQNESTGMEWLIGTVTGLNSTRVQLI